MAPLAVHVREPGPVPLDLAVRGGEEGGLQLFRDGPASVGADGMVVDLTDGSDLRGGARVERLLGRVQVEPGEVALDHGDPEVAGDGDDRVPGDAVEASGLERWRVQHAVPDD